MPGCGCGGSLEVLRSCGYPIHYIYIYMYITQEYCVILKRDLLVFVTLCTIFQANFHT